MNPFSDIDYVLQAPSVPPPPDDPITQEAPVYWCPRCGSRTVVPYGTCSQCESFTGRFAMRRGRFYTAAFDDREGQ